jgi:plastocyanin
MRKLSIAVLLTLLAAAPAAAAPRKVSVGDDWFVRDGRAATVTVNKGKKVRWRWVGRDQHNVVVQSGPRRFQSPLKRSGRYTKKMRKRGTYKIVCSIHQPDMRMTLVVR